ncbi:splicing factor ESS-2 homolog [Prorops nasuta]|uniref:splicing factor ESS-2 homolog n=1 Tax=Prorops nasuta TaxID=863751 RepID=UPI0034CD75CC
MDTPGSQALEAVKTIKDVDIFKKPIGVYRRKKAKVLDEDTYIEKMAEIIQRDFFPHLEKLHAQNDYLDALEQNDIKRMRELYAKYSSGRPATERPASPATFETPQREPSNNDECQLTNSETRLTKDKQDKVENDKKNERRIGLDEYLSTTTSEDNASFEELMVEMEKKHRLKYAWLYQPEGQLQLENGENQKHGLLAIENKNTKPKQIDTWCYKNKNHIMYVPDGVDLTVDERIEMAKKRQQVAHVNTRLNVNPFNEQQNKETICELAKSQSKTSDGKIGVDGKEIIRNPTPRVNGFSFVATPSPRPGECESPLMTWGQIEGTPFRLDGGDTPLLRTSQGPAFRMAEPPKREQIALQLAEKVGERHRDRKIKALEVARRSLASPSPRSTIDRLSTMSPAARRLATQKLRITTACTPSPRASTTSRTPSIGIRTPKTPLRNSMSTRRDPTTTVRDMESGANILGPVLTDNLLNLPPQRQRASDFFNN